MGKDQEKSAKETARLLQESQKTGEALGLTYENIADIQEKDRYNVVLANRYCKEQ